MGEARRILQMSDSHEIVTTSVGLARKLGTALEHSDLDLFTESAKVQDIVL
jgi:hypothetical protein